MSSGKAETRVAILEAARNLIEERGASAVRLSDIAREAGISRQGVYLHFDSRADLLVALVQFVDRRERLGHRAADVWTAADAKSALERFAALQADYTPRIYPVARALMAERHRDEAAASAWEDRMAGRRAACLRLIEWLRSDAALNPRWSDDGAADALWTLTSIQVWEQLVIDRGWTPEQYEHHLQVILRQTFIR